MVLASHLQLSLVRPWQSAGRPEKDRMASLAMQSPIMARSPGSETMPKMRHTLNSSVLHMWTPQMMTVVYISETRPWWHQLSCQHRIPRPMALNCYCYQGMPRVREGVSR